MKSFGGLGGDFADEEFCDTLVINTENGNGQSKYPWWRSFSEGKRFYVPRVAQLNNVVTNFNIAKLTKRANHHFKTFGTHYPNAADFGRKSFDKIVNCGAMSFGKAVMALRTVNEVLAHNQARDEAGNIIQIGRGELVMSGYRIEGLKAALSHYSQAHTKDVESQESAVEKLAREADIATFIVDALSTDDGKYVVFPTALVIARALLRSRHEFGIPGNADESVFVKLGPPPGSSFNRLDLKLSVEETADPKLRDRVTPSPHPENPFRRIA